MIQGQNICTEKQTPDKKYIDESWKRFIATFTCTKAEQSLINAGTAGQSRNKRWHEMRHLMITGKKVNGLYTRQRTL